MPTILEQITKQWNAYERADAGVFTLHDVEVMLGIADVLAEDVDWESCCGDIAPVLESQFGFTRGERVNYKLSSVGVNPGVVMGFYRDRILVKWDTAAVRNLFDPSELRHGE